MQHDWNKYMAWSTGGWLPAWTQSENCRSAHVNAQADPIHGPSSLPEVKSSSQAIGGDHQRRFGLWPWNSETNWSLLHASEVAQNPWLVKIVFSGWSLWTLKFAVAQIAIYIDVKTATWFQQIHGLADSQLSNVCQVLISNGSTLRLAGSCPWCNPLSLLLPHQIGIKSGLDDQQCRTNCLNTLELAGQPCKLRQHISNKVLSYVVLLPSSRMKGHFLVIRSYTSRVRAITYPCLRP